MKDDHVKRIGLFKIILVFFMASVGLVPNLLAANDDDSSELAQPIDYQRYSKIVTTIGAKTPVDILAGEQRFTVSLSTAIFTKEKEQISFEDLPVPCRVRLFFEPLKMRDADAVKIEILSVMAGAVTEWTPNPPE